MQSAKQSHFRAWPVRVLALFAMAIAAPGAQASLTISTAPTNNVTCSAGVCTATAPDAVLNVVNLKYIMRRGNLQIYSGPADSIGVEAPLNSTGRWALLLTANTTIGVDAPLNWRGSSLILIANTGITFSQPVVVSEGSVTLNTPDHSLGAGAVSFTGHGRLDFLGPSSLSINDKVYQLVGDLPSLAYDVAAKPSGDFALAKSYDAKADGPYTASPIYVLYGSLNGLGHTISNLTIESSEACAGLIGYLVQGTAPSVSYLTLVQLNLTQTPTRGFAPPNGVGGLAGCSQGAVSHVHVAGRVTGGNSAIAGGVIGWQGSGPVGAGPISDTSAKVVVSAGPSSEAGGIIGYDLFGNVQRCAVEGQIREGTGGDAGGLVGLAQLSFASITGSWSSARVVGTNAGGLIGHADGSFILADNYASGTVSSGGGLIGVDTASRGSGNTIQRSYARGPVHGGGVTGNDDGTGTYANVYWDLDTTHVTNPAKGVLNIPNYPGITGLSDAQMTAGLPAGFDPNVWGQNVGINNGYPYLLANPPL